MKATDRVKIIEGAFAGAVGEVVSIDEEWEVAVVYISGIVNGVAVHGQETLHYSQLEAC